MKAVIGMKRKEAVIGGFSLIPTLSFSATGRETGKPRLNTQTKTLPDVGRGRQGAFFQLPNYYFFLETAFLAGAAPHGVVFTFSTFAFSASMVSINGSFVNAFGTPVH